MEKPDLTRVVEAWIPVTDFEIDAYFARIRDEICPAIKVLRTNGDIRWFSFLLHGCPPHLKNEFQGADCWHFRFEPSLGADLNEFMRRIESTFKYPRHGTDRIVSGLSGDLLQERDWSIAWKLIGEASEFALSLCESHSSAPPATQTIQFMHYITNPMLLGHQCKYDTASF